MSYRDDLEAALAQVEALKGELAEAGRRLKSEQDEVDRWKKKWMDRDKVIDAKFEEAPVIGPYNAIQGHAADAYRYQSNTRSQPWAFNGGSNRGGFGGSNF